MDQASASTRRRQQNRVADCGFFLAAAEHPGGDSGRFGSEAIAPAAKPWRVGAEKFFERFQSRTGGKGGIGFTDVVSSRPRPARQAVRPARDRWCGGKQINET